MTNTQKPEVASTTGSAVEASTVATSSASVIPPLHDAAQQARNLRQVLQDDKQRIGCFLGAGCPLGVYNEAGLKSVVLIPAVAELTKRVAKGLESADNAAGSSSVFKKNWDALCDECKAADCKVPTVEDVLTELRTLALRRGSAPMLGMTKQDLSDLDDKVCALIVAEIRKPLPAYRNSYSRFASWIGGVHRDSPAEIFTPNYDLLFEQALEQHPLPHFDGFVGSREPWFDLASIEHDAIPARWTRRARTARRTAPIKVPRALRKCSRQRKRSRKASR